MKHALNITCLTIADIGVIISFGTAEECLRLRRVMSTYTGTSSGTKSKVRSIMLTHNVL